MGASRQVAPDTTAEGAGGEPPGRRQDPAGTRVSLAIKGRHSEFHRDADKAARSYRKTSCGMTLFQSVIPRCLVDQFVTCLVGENSSLISGDAVVQVL